MLLCASAKEGKEGGGVEFVLPPAGSQPGERIYFEGEKYESEFYIPFRTTSLSSFLDWSSLHTGRRMEADPK